MLSARLKRLREYPWSSYRSYAGYVSGPDWLTTQELLRRTARRVDERARAYRERVQQMLKRGAEETRLEQFREVLAVGSTGFVDRIKEMASGGGRETERRGRLKGRVSFEQVVEAVEACRGEPRGDWLDRHGDWGKWMVLRVARAQAGMTLAELGKAIGGKDYAAVGMGLRYFEKKLRKDKVLQRLHRQIQDF